MCSSKTSSHGSRLRMLVEDSTTQSLPFAGSPLPTRGAVGRFIPRALCYLGTPPGRAQGASRRRAHGAAGRAQGASCRRAHGAAGRAQGASLTDTVVTQHLNTISRVGVVGLGTIGAQELALWQRAGLQPIGYDISEARAQVPGGSTRVEDLDPADALVLCLPNLAPSGENSLAAFDHFVDMVQRLSPRERLVVIASTVPIGFTRHLAERLGHQGRVVSHAPERFDPGRGTELGEIPRVVGALSEQALEATIALYARAKVPTHRVELVEVAEASKLLENSFRLVNISFINEFAELCRRMGIVAADVIDA